MMMMMMTSHSHASHSRVPCRSKNVMRCRNGCNAPSVPNGARSASLSSSLEAPGRVAPLLTLPSPSLLPPFISPRCYKLYGLAVREILQGALHQHTASQSCCSLVSYTAVVVSRGFLARNAFTKHIHFCNLLLSCESGSFYLER